MAKRKSASSTRSNTAAIIMAAGKGTRMRSKLPKVLHPVGGLPLVAHVVRAAVARRCDPIVVVLGSDGRRVRDMLSARFHDAPLVFAEQTTQRGTGDAARVGMDAMPKFRGSVLILNGDVPLIQPETLAKLQRAARKSDFVILSAHLPDPTGYGRVVRAGRRVAKVVEHRDATDDELGLDECNVGIYSGSAAFIRRAVAKLETNNSQGELYLTDLVDMAASKGGAGVVVLGDVDQAMGINDRFQLAEVEQIFRFRKVFECMGKGVTFVDPDTALLEADVRIDADATVGPWVQLRGRTHIKSGAYIEGPCVIIDSIVHEDGRVHAFSHLEGATVRKQASIGPYARLRPEADVGEGARVGNFVEVKKSTLGKGAKANHLAYIGDATVGAGSNVGAGTITCNYDGTNKHQTILGAGVFVGSNTTLVAPVTLGKGVYVAAGSTITKDVPAEALAFGRSRQENRAGYGKRLRDAAERNKKSAKTESKSKATVKNTKSSGASTRAGRK